MQHHFLPIAARERQLRERTSHSQDEAAVVAAEHLDFAEIHSLATRAPALTASIYLPTHRAGSDRQQDHTRLKNLLHQARRLLAEASDERRADAILLPAEKLVEHQGFWKHPSDGLALFCSESGLQHLWVPAAMPELAIVCEHCHIKPLMPVLQGDGLFYLLELTQHGVHLHVGSRFGLCPVDLLGAPTSIDDAIGHPESEHHTEVRTVQAAGQGAVRYFGSVGDERAKERISQYFRRIDACIIELLHGERAPLVIAGVDYLLPLYHAVNHYPHLMQTGIPGNQDLSPTAALHDRAWKIVSPTFSKVAAAAIENYAQLHGSNRISDDLAVILSTAFQGRIENLFVANDIERWGTYDVVSDKIRQHEPRWPADDDLLNVALIQCLATRAHVQVMPISQMPGKAEIAAEFRF